MNISTLTTGWNFMRILRLALGIIFLIQAFQNHDYLIGSFSLLFIVQAVTNTGCCGSQVCNTPINKTTNKDAEEVVFEEVKN